MIGLLAMAAALNVFETGNDLYRVCDANPQGECASYIAGIADEIQVMQAGGSSPRYYCPSRYVTIGQVRDVALKALQDNPASRDQVAASLVTVALDKAFPCPK